MVRKIALKSKTATKSIKIVQISDAHLIVCDKNDVCFKEEKFRKFFFERETLDRVDEILYAEEELINSIEYANSVKADLVVFPGDIIEFCTDANIDRMIEIFGKVKSDYLYTFGNHDYYPGKTELTQRERRELYREKFQSKIKNDIDFAVKEINGVKFVTIDNSDCQFSERHYSELKKVFSDNKDVAIFTHIPLASEHLTNTAIAKIRRPSFGCGSEHDMTLIDYPTDVTKKVIELIKENHEKVIGLFAGHEHYEAIYPYYKNIVCYVSNVNYAKEFFEIDIEKE